MDNTSNAIKPITFRAWKYEKERKDYHEILDHMEILRVEILRNERDRFKIKKDKSSGSVSQSRYLKQVLKFLRQELRDEARALNRWFKRKERDGKPHRKRTYYEIRMDTEYRQEKDAFENDEE
jgi:hypothetical protein